MSIKVMTDVWAYADCKGSELLTLLALADFSDDYGENIYPSMQTLAAKTRLHETQARRIVQTLIKRGLLEVIEQGGWQHGRNRSNSYRIRLENIKPDSGSIMLSPPSRGRDHSGSTGASTVVAPAPDDPSSEPLYKPPSKKMRPTHGRKQKKSYQPEDYDDL